MILQIKRGKTVIAETSNFSYTPSLQEVRPITCEILTVEKLEFKPYNSKAETTYDTVTYNGSTFILFNASSGEHRNEAGKYKYSLVFYGKEVLLKNLAFLDVVSGDISSSINQTRYTHGGIFSFFGDHKQLAQRIIANIDTYNASLSSAYVGIGTWTITFDVEGDVLESTIDISDGTNIFDALKHFYDTFNLNYYFSTTASGGNILVTDKKRGVIDWTFKQGDGNGAISLSSSVDTNTPIVTRVIPQGGSRNVPPDYKKNSSPVDDTRYCPFILLPDVNGNIRYYLDSNYGLSKYGIRGRTVSADFSGIYPTIRGKVLGDLYPGGLPAYDTYLSNGNVDPQSGVVAGTGVSASTRIDKIIGSSVIKSENDSTFNIYVTSPGFNLGYKVYTEGASGGNINETFTPSFNDDSATNKHVSFRIGGLDGPGSKSLYTVARYYDQMLNVVGKTEGVFYAVLTNYTTKDYSGADVSFNLRLRLNGNQAGASATITVKFTTDPIFLSFEGQTLNGVYTGVSGSVFADIVIEASCPQAQTNEIGVRLYKNTGSATINFNNISGIQNEKYYFKYGTASNAIISMRSGLYSGTEFEIDKNGVIPLHGVVDLSRGETEEDVAFFSKGARYKYVCRRTEADGTKYPFASTDNSEALAAGSEFVLLNLIMPETYVTMAENTLLKASQDYLARYDHENKTVSINISSGFVAEHPSVFTLFDIGNIMKVRDDAIGIYDLASDGALIDMELQIQGLEIKYTESALFPTYSCTVARMKSLSFYERLAKENQTYNTTKTTNISVGSGSGNANNIFSDGLINELIQAWTEFGSFFEFDKAKNAIRAKYALYTDDWLSAKGSQTGSGGGGTGGGVIKSLYRFADLGKTFDDNNNDTFTAYTINEIWKMAKEGGGIKSLTVSGAGNAITNLTLSADGKTITATKDIEFLKKTDIDVTKFVTIDTAQEISGAKIFTADINPKTTNVTSLGTSLLRWKNIYTQTLNAVTADITTVNAAHIFASTTLQVGDVQIKFDATSKAIYFEHKDGKTPIGLYSLGWISAKGVQIGGGSGSGGLITNIYRFADLGGDFDDNNNDTFTAYTINKIWESVQAGMGIKTLTVTGSGNAITNMTLSADGRTITATKGASFATADAFNTLNTKVNDFLTGTDTDNIINKWKELEAFLSGMAETDNLATILATKADKTITISAGAGLTGGGNLSANRSFALATSGAKAGTYTKVTVDVYGRVTSGAALAEADLPSISWGKITGKPTTLAGYGITDAYTKAQTDAKYVTIATAQDITGAKRFTTGVKLGSGASTLISESTTNFFLRVSLGETTGALLRWDGSTGKNLFLSSTGGGIYFRPQGDQSQTNQMVLNTAGNLSLNGILASSFLQVGDGVIRWDAANKAIYFEHKDGKTIMGVYSKGWMSALGAQTGSGGGSTTLAGLSDVTITTPANGQALIYDGSKWVNKTIQQGLDTTAMWNALKAVDATKVIDVSHIPNLSWSKITSGKPTTLAGYGITDGVNIVTVSGSGNAITTAAISGHTITLTKGATFLTAHQSLTNYYTKTESDSRYVTALGTSGNYLTWTKNGTSNNITVPYATKSGSSDWLNTNTKLTYGASGLNYFNLDGKAGTTANSNVTPVNGWYHILRMNHGNTSGYFADIAVPINTLDGVWWRQIRGGTNYGWYKLLDTNNYDRTLGSVYVKKTGDAMSGQLVLGFNADVKLIMRSADADNFGLISMQNSSGTQLSYLGYKGTGWYIDNERILTHTNYSGYLDGRYVNVTGDTMTGDLSSNNRFITSYASGSWISSVRYAALTVNHRGYGGIWCAPTKSGRVVMSTYPSNDDKVYLGYANNSQISAGTNALNIQTHWNAATGFWYANGYTKTDSSNAYVLLGGGGHKALSTMQSEYDARYVNTTGDTMTGALRISSGYVYLNSGWFQNDASGVGLYNSNQDARWFAQNSRWNADKYIRAPYFESTVGTGTQPYKCSSTTLNTNLNADKLDNYDKESFESYYATRIDARNLDQNTWYPVTMRIGNSLRTRIRVEGNTAAPASWNTRNDKRMSLYLDYSVNGSSWGWTPVFRVVYSIVEGSGTSHCIGGIGQLDQSSTEYVYVRGGAEYDFYTSRFITPVLRTSTYTTSGQSIAPITSPAWVNRNNALISDNVASATQLQNARTINGTSFNGTANITTSYWGTTRTFYTNSYDSYKSSAGVSVNGSGNVTLLLPTSIRCSEWFRSIGVTGWYNETYGGGIYMSDTVYVRVYNNKKFYVSNAENTDFSTATALSTSGGIYAVKNITSNANIYAKGAMTAKSSSSDIRLKRDIKDFSAMDILRKIQPKQFYWNSLAKSNSPALNNDYRQYGLIAQSIQNMPELEGFVDNIFKDYLIIHYEKFIPIALEGIKEVDDEVTKLKKRVEVLEKENEMLKRRIPA